MASPMTIKAAKKEVEAGTPVVWTSWKRGHQGHLVAEPCSHRCTAWASRRSSRS